MGADVGVRVQILATLQDCSELKPRVEALEKKDVLGGTSTLEKVGILGQAVALVARFIAAVFGIKIPIV